MSKEVAQQHRDHEGQRKTSGGWITLDDPSMQVAEGGPFSIWEQAVDFGAIPGDKVVCTVAAIVRQEGGGTGKVEVRIGGDFNDSDGESVASFETSKDSSELKKKTAEIEKPEGLTLVKLLAGTKGSEGQLLVRGKSISFRPAGR